MCSLGLFGGTPQKNRPKRKEKKTLSVNYERSKLPANWTPCGMRDGIPIYSTVQVISTQRNRNEMGIRPLVCLFISCTRCSATREREKERDCARVGGLETEVYTSLEWC